MQEHELLDHYQFTRAAKRVLWCTVGLIAFWILTTLPRGKIASLPFFLAIVGIGITLYLLKTRGRKTLEWVGGYILDFLVWLVSRDHRR